MVVNTSDPAMIIAPDDRIDLRELDFDFHDLPISGIEGRVMNVQPGPLQQFDRTVGIQFTKIDPIVKRDLNRIVMRDKARGTA